MQYYPLSFAKWEYGAGTPISGKFQIEILSLPILDNLFHNLRHHIRILHTVSINLREAFFAGFTGITSDPVEHMVSLTGQACHAPNPGQHPDQ